MKYFFFISRLTNVKRLIVLSLVTVISYLPLHVLAHPMPNSIVLLDIKQDGVAAELQLPLSELQLAFGQDINDQTATLINRFGPQLRSYIALHIHPVSPDGKAWSVIVQDLVVQPAEQTATGPYSELTAKVWMQPPAAESSRYFTLNYDVIIHQVVTHIALVSIRQDWDKGIYTDHPVDVGVIRLDVRNNVIPPLVVNQESGSLWIGFKSMLNLGIQHIAEGTDHLLFLLALLLPVPLLASNKRWAGFGGTRYSIIHILQVVTAFTIGHSLTLLAGSLGWFRLPGRPVEIMIAFSILVSAIHAFRPLFPGKEMFVAAGFGLIHGMAFATVLANLNLNAGRMALSILGFNIGIELMQLFVIALTVPWLIILSRTHSYYIVRIAGALFAGIAAIAWMTERMLNQPNAISTFITANTQYASWLILLLACLGLISYWKQRRQSQIEVVL